jgi:glycosyltransferase involved in cell wall biosynthesis
MILRHPVAGVKVRHVATFGTESKLRRALWYLRALPSAVEGILSGGTDLVHVHFSSRGSTARKLPLVMLALAARKPVILHAHGAQFDEFFRALPGWARRAVAAVFGRATAVVVLSDSWRAFYMKHFGLTDGQCVVLRNPVELPLSLPDRRGRSDVTFVSLGRIGNRKGSFESLEAVAAIKPHGLPVRLVLAGDGEVEAARRRATSLGISGQVEVLGWAGPREREQLLERADVFLLPSHQEGLPMALLEAMAAGLPAITTPVGGIPEVVTHEREGLLARPGDVPGIAQAIQWMCEHPDERLAMGRAARLRVQPMSIDHYMSRLSRLCQSAVGPRNPQPITPR